MLFPRIHTYTDRWHTTCVQYSLTEHTAWATNKNYIYYATIICMASLQTHLWINEIGGIRVFVNRMEYLSTEARCLA